MALLDSLPQDDGNLSMVVDCHFWVQPTAFGTKIVLDGGPLRYFTKCVPAQTMKQRIFILHADLCGMMASPKRLAIMESLHEGERSVSSIAEELGTSVSTVSQHLRLLRDKHVVLSRKDAQTVYYRIRDPRMIDACNIIRSVLLDGIKAQGIVGAEALGE